MTVQTGRLQLKHLTLSYNNSSYFRIEVTPQGRQTYRYEVTGRVLGDGSNVLGSVPLRSGKKSVPILSRNDRVTIELVNESWMPSASSARSGPASTLNRVKGIDPRVHPTRYRRRRHTHCSLPAAGRR
jgi:hypothetical protein